MNREGWLTAAMSALRPHFRKAGLIVPRKTRVSCSWPSHGGMARKHTSRVDGETWFYKNSAPEISISPTLGQDDVEVLGTLAHEMVHASIGGRFDHRHKEFRLGIIAVGLTEGRPSASKAGPELRMKLAKISKKLGPYPHTGVRI